MGVEPAFDLAAWRRKAERRLAEAIGLGELDWAPHALPGHVRRRRAANIDQHIPADTVLLSLDEKTGIQAKSRKHPTRPVWRASQPAASSSTAATAPCR